MIRRILRIGKRVIKRIFKVCSGCTLLYRTNWYKSFFVDADHQIYPGNEWYREHAERNFDVVNLGSSGGKWAFDYEDTGLKGMNWAQQPQTLQEDYNLFRCYHSVLRKGGYVLITIMPFTGLNKETGLRDAMKYVKLNTQGEPVQPHLYEKAIRLAEYPILMGLPAIKALVKFFVGRDNVVDRNILWNVDKNPMTDVQLAENAESFMNGWKKQFCISDFEAPLTEKNNKGREYRIGLMRELVDFCKEREYVPVYIIPPVTEYLAKNYTPKFRQLYIYDYLKQVERDVKLLDYSDDKELMEKDLYFNSFFMNRRGAKIFTERVLKDLELK